MARSKFPGKPLKPVNRTAINVLPSSTSEGEINLTLTSSKLKQNDCDSGIDTIQRTSRAGRNAVHYCRSTSRTTEGKRACKNLISKKNSLWKRSRSGTTPTRTDLLLG